MSAPDGEPEPVPRLNTTPLPEWLWLGMTLGQWPIQAFSAEGHALYWLESAPAGEQRRLWRVELTSPQEMEVVRERAYLRRAQ